MLDIIRGGRAFFLSARYSYLRWSHRSDWLPQSKMSLWGRKTSSRINSSASRKCYKISTLYVIMGRLPFFGRPDLNVSNCTCRAIIFSYISLTHFLLICYFRAFCHILLPFWKRIISAIAQNKRKCPPLEIMSYFVIMSYYMRR